jgi:hypothetical protein
MKESIRVKLAISVWVVGAILLFVVASIVLTDMFRGNRDKEPLTQIELRLKNLADGMLSSDVEGVVISVVRRDGDVCSVACGTLLGENEPLVPGLGSLSYISGQMYGVERGDITLDSVIERYSMYDGSSRISFVELSNLAIMLLNGGVVGGERVLSNATIEEMMSHKLGWHQLSYSTLLGQESIEFCTSQGAMILNLEMGVAIAIGVDSQVPLDDEEFEALRSKVASVVAALE